MKKYFILFLMLVLTNCYKTTSNGIRYISDSTAYSILFTVLVAPPIYVATLGVSGVTIGTAILYGVAGVIVSGLIILPAIDCQIDYNKKSECGNAK